MRIHHVALRTRDLERLRRFYADVLGLRVTQRSGERSVWLAAGDTIVMIERSEEGEPPIPPGSMEMLAFAIVAEERQAMAARLRNASVPIEAETSFTLYFRDPDGRRVGLSHFEDRES